MAVLNLGRWTSEYGTMFDIGVDDDGKLLFQGSMGWACCPADHAIYDATLDAAMEKVERTVEWRRV